jgi:hypothetical protein
MMWQFLKLDAYTLVVPGPEDHEAIQNSIHSGLQSNTRFLEALTEKPRGGRLTGSFIYAHPPDYIGRPTMDWNVDQWRLMLQELKELGIDTVIYQAAAWLEVRECYYPSRLLNAFTTWDSLGALCQAVAAEGMTLFLGGLGNLMAFDEKVTDEAIRQDIETQLTVFSELVEGYGGGFQGFYMSPETAFPGKRQPERELRLNRYFQSICQGVKDILPGIPVLASPATFYTAGKETEIHDFLYNLFAGVPIDFMTPQDSIGTFGNRLENLQPSFAIWKQLSQEIGFHLWANVESFQRYRIGTDCDFLPADFGRLVVQLANANQVAEKIVSWEVPYFYSSLAGEPGIRLRQAYLASLDAGER